MSSLGPWRWRRCISSIARLATAAALRPPSRSEPCSWPIIGGRYHWARTTTSFNLTIVNSTTSDWDPYVSQAIGDWSTNSNVLDTIEDPNGSTKTGIAANAAALRRRSHLQFRIRIQWLAGYRGDFYRHSSGHIVTGYTKLNDSYFSTSTLTRPDWKQSVACPELGHNIGLDHQDEDFDNVSLFSCMDYQDPPFEFPNDHDYGQLQTIYGHLDSYPWYSGGSAGGGGTCNSPPGEGLQQGGRAAGPAR